MANRLDIDHFLQLCTDQGEGSVCQCADWAMIEHVRRLPICRQPGQLSFALVILCHQGRIQTVINDETYTGVSGDLIFCSGLHTLTAAMTSSDFCCDLFCVSIRKYQEMITPDKKIMTNFLFAYKQPLIHLTDNERRMVADYQLLIRAKAQEGEATDYTLRIMNALIQAMILEFVSACERRQVPVNTNGEADGRTKSQLAHRFLLLLSEDSCRHRSVGYFAAQLCVSAKYLTAVVKKETGKTVSQWIHEQLTEQIRQLLTSSSLSCKEIAMRLDFPNCSFFGKYVKERLGCSPMKYRENVFKGKKVKK
ncbi:MAG: helix-turn-helix domain-containing protein [Prevotella sp.]